LLAARPVSRILSARLLRQDGHSSGPHITARLKRPTRRFGAPSRHAPGRSLRSEPGFLPIWSCSVWGLPCPLHCWSGGALLPHLFTLTSTSPSRRYVFCGTSRQPVLKPASRTLSGTLLCGVRTFLSPHPERRRERPSGPAAYREIICDKLYSGPDYGGTIWQTTQM
jgi:hypothetical protein